MKKKLMPIILLTVTSLLSFSTYAASPTNPYSNCIKNCKQMYERTPNNNYGNQLREEPSIYYKQLDDDLEGFRVCKNAFNESAAASSCRLQGTTEAVRSSDGTIVGCAIKAACPGKNLLGVQYYYNTYANPQLKDVKRLVNCNGSLEYDRC